MSRLTPAISLFAPLLLAPALAHGASTFLDVTTALEYNTNQSNAEAASDREDGFIASTSAAATHQIILSDKFGLQLGGRLEGDGNVRFGDLSRIGAGIDVTLNFKPVPGYTAPWFALGASSTLSEFNGSSIRDGVSSRFSLTAGKRITEQVGARVGYAFDWREAFGGRAFDTKGHSLFASLSYQPDRRWLLYARYDIRRGEVTSTATPTDAVLAASGNVFDADDAFGVTSTQGGLLLNPLNLLNQLIGLGDRQRFAYRIDATSHQARVGANYALNEDMSLDLSARYRNTRGDQDNQYQMLAVQGAFLYRFR